MINYINPQQHDAQQIVDFYNSVGGETSYLSFGANEYPLSVEQQRQEMAATAFDCQQLMILAKDEDRIVGIGTMSTSSKAKSRHVTELGIVVSKNYQNQKIGRNIMEKMIAWAESNQIIEKIQLDTRADNILAVSLYMKLGFVVEGILKNTTLFEGKYYDLYVMGKQL
ncbi:GNAT family N-acetyltransferase [Kurthia sibirica]|uniref:GNAT family N-acetyltransferase n=1 Tax=Kurthia sibirica TaxID=202750 RepID=A0A2U3ALM4_9BACL|nr:GNAT family N-acetyltransferase [Kurthia sibirica]PWI25424.1 GNAT family N-acetyltransferase [Kurthia sibirica]GEK34340.1 N-acetyltransferase [Kurthia sibirica]